MASDRAKKLIDQGNALYDNRGTLMSLWQEIAWNFYVERADFTTKRVIGTTFAEQLMTSYPVIARRTLGDSITSILRPGDREWFDISTNREDKIDDQGRRWLYWAKGVQRRAMYDRRSMFHRATKEADHDFAAFGQAVLSVEMNAERNRLLYRCWHLRDVVWAESVEGVINEVHRKWKIDACKAVAMFPNTVSGKIKDIAKKYPHQKICLRHVVLSSDFYNEYIVDKETGRKVNHPWVSIYLEEDGEEILEEVGMWTKYYIIPRWQTVSGSQYAYSPATVAALPDARLLQAVTLTLLEAGERFTNPPMIATQEAIRSDIQLYAGGITWVDTEYDERLGEVLRPLTQDRGGMPLGADMRNDIRSSLAECFYLDKLGLPPVDQGKNERVTAFEVSQRMNEYIRQALPLFEPMEMEYNGAMCDDTFDVILRNGGFGPWHDIPHSIAGQEIQFRFSSPLSDAIGTQQATKLMTAKQILANVIDLDPTQSKRLIATVALKDALLGAGVPPTWIETDEDFAKIQAQMQKQQQTDAIMSNMERGSNVAKTLADAAGSAAQVGSASQQPDQQAQGAL